MTLITANLENIQAALSTVKAFVVGAFFGAVGGLSVSGGPGIGGGNAASAAKAGAHQSIGIAKEHTDAGKVSDAEKAHEEAEERNATWRERARSVFDSIDTDGNGVLNQDEILAATKRKSIQSVFLENDLLMSKSMFNKFFADIDTNHNGVIDFDEFVNAVRKTDPHWHSDEVENATEGDDGKDMPQPTDSSAKSSPTFKKALWARLSFRRSSGAVIDAGDIVVTCGENDNKESESQPAVEININKSPTPSHRSSVPSVPSQKSLVPSQKSSASEPPQLPRWVQDMDDDDDDDDDHISNIDCHDALTAKSDHVVDMERGEAFDVLVDTGVVQKAVPWNVEDAVSVHSDDIDTLTEMEDFSQLPQEQTHTREKPSMTAGNVKSGPRGSWM
jgi:hypothetical protein